MKTLECIIFDVEHGFSAFIKSPNNYGLLIDCRRKQNFSPIKWIRANYNIGIGNINYFEKRRIAKLVITHLHADHLSDVGHLIDTEKPKHLLRDKESIKFIDQKIKTKSNDEATKILRDFKAFKMVSTRERSASIKVVIFEDGSTEVSLLETRDNLNRDQKKILERRTDKILSAWNMR